MSFDQSNWTRPWVGPAQHCPRYGVVHLVRLDDGDGFRTALFDSNDEEITDDPSG